jgi:hypothetical protein
MQIAGSNLNIMLKVSLGHLFLSIGAAVLIGAAVSIGAAVCLPSATRAQGATIRKMESRPAEPVRTIPLRAESWEFQPGAVEFLAAAPTIAGLSPEGPAMKIVSRKGGAVVAKNTDISEGMIDFDIVPTDSNFASFFFHRQDALEAE